MYCTNCGANIPDGDSFCTNCGTKVEQSQPQPQNPMKPGMSGGKIAAIIIAVIGGLAIISIVSCVLLLRAFTSAFSENVEEFSVDTEESWFDNAGLEITPQGDFTYHTMANDGIEDTEEIEITGNVSITHSTEGMDDGFKRVTATFVYDISEAKKKGVDEVSWLSVFDRYTGTSFEFNETFISSQADQPDLKNGFARIMNGDDYYDVKVDYYVDGDHTDNIIVNEISVICPETYDGAVFQIGYSALELAPDVENTDYSVLHTIDEFAHFDSNGHEYLYFSESNN